MLIRSLLQRGSKKRPVAGNAPARAAFRAPAGNMGEGQDVNTG